MVRCYLINRLLSYMACHNKYIHLSFTIMSNPQDRNMYNDGGYNNYGNNYNKNYNPNHSLKISSIEFELISL